MKIKIDRNDWNATLDDDESGVWKQTSGGEWNWEFTAYGENALIIVAEPMQNGWTGVVVVLTRVDSCPIVNQIECPTDEITETINSVINHILKQ